MKIKDALAQLDKRHPNSYSMDEKVQMLSRAEAMVKRLVICTHEGAEDCTFNGYGPGTDQETELLMPEPYDEAYLFWCESRMAYSDGEYEDYNAAVAQYDALFQAYADEYNRSHMPLSPKFRYL